MTKIAELVEQAGEVDATSPGGLGSVTERIGTAARASAHPSSRWCGVGESTVIRCAMARVRTRRSR